MLGWNYRVIRKQVEIDYYQYEIHEVYYDDNGEPESWTEESMKPFGESFLELQNDLNYMMKATQKLILEEKEIDGELRLVEISK